MCRLYGNCLFTNKQKLIKELLSISLPGRNATFGSQLKVEWRKREGERKRFVENKGTSIMNKNFEHHSSKGLGIEDKVEGAKTTKKMWKSNFNGKYGFYLRGLS